MLYLVCTALIFEIIFAIVLIIAIVNLDRRINKFNVYILENRYKIREVFRLFRKDISKCSSALKGLGDKLRKKRNNFLVNLLKKFVIAAGLRIFLRKYKKQLLYAELILIAYETIQNSIKA